jgi:hypothetical protein
MNAPAPAHKLPPALKGGVLRLTLAASLALAGGAAFAAPGFSAAEQLDMNRAALIFDAKYNPGSAKYPACVALQGAIPTQAFLDSLGEVGKGYRPWPAGTALGASPCERSTIIRAFSRTAPNIAEARIEHGCGSLCGNLATIRLRKTSEKWTADSIKFNIHF